MNISGFMVADLLSQTEFTIISDSKVVVDSLSDCSSLTDIYSFLGCFFCRALPSQNLKKGVRHAPRKEVHTADCLSHQARTKISQQFRLFRLTASSILTDEAIIFNFSQLFLYEDVSLDSLFASVVSPLPPFMEDHKNCSFSYDVH